MLSQGVARAAMEWAAIFGAAALLTGIWNLLKKI
jgi:hypothetical protein